MSSSISTKSPCATCGKISGLFMCRGCGKDFCMRHANEHRQELGKQMDELTLDHDQFRENLTEETTQSQYYIHMKEKIDQWEQQSIEKIHQVANDTHRDLQNIIEQYSTKLTESLTKIANEINQARKEDDFFETDIQEWIKQLNSLKDHLIKPPEYDIHQDKNVSIPFISKICIDVAHNDVFDRLIGNVQLKDNNQVILHGQSDGYATVRGKGEYSYEQHRLRFQIEEYHSSRWIFIGIISKDISMEENSINSRSLYGWAGPNQVYINGVYNAGFNNYQSDVQKNDIIQLFIDCNQQTICLINERTNSSYKLEINLNKCPFPWQLNVIMYFLDDRIRFLST